MDSASSGVQGAGSDGRPQQPRSPESVYNQDVVDYLSASSPGVSMSGPSSCGNHSNAGSIPSRGAESDFDYQQSNISLLKAQLNLVTHERDMLKKDVKRMERDKQHLFAAAGVLDASGNSFNQQQPHHHYRTVSDTASATSGKPGHSSTLSRSHSIATDKNLMLSAVSPTSPTSSTVSGSTSFRHSSQGPSSGDVQHERLLLEIQFLKKQNNDILRKCDQTMKDAEYYHNEAESLKGRFNEVAAEKQRLEEENNSLQIYMEEDRKELQDLRRQQQEMLACDGNNSSEGLSIMYGTLLRSYEAVKEEYAHVRKRFDDLAASHASAVGKLDQSMEETLRYKKLYQEMLTERNQFKQQCTQAIRQWDQALRERNDYREALSKVQRQHDEAIKEINQAMTVRIKASKDLKRLAEERNAAMQEYSLIMSERDSVHKEIEKLQDEVQETKRKMNLAESRSKLHDEERKKLVLQTEMLKREIEQCLQDRDKAMKESHELREKFVGGKALSDLDQSKSSHRNRLDLDKHRKDRNSASSETIDITGSNLNLEVGSKERVDNLETANSEIDRLRKIIEKLTGELQDASLEADVAKGRRDWAFSERDKVVLERESIRTLCDKLRRERDRAVSELAEALRDSDEGKKLCNETAKENKELRDRVESLEKEICIKSLQRSPGHSHSHDSAIDADMHEWETETVDLDMNGLGSQEDLGMDLAGGRDDLHCPGEKPIYISSIGKGSFLDGKLRVNDCILRVNNIDCRDLDRTTVLHSLRNANSTVSLLIKRRKSGKRYQAALHLGLSTDSGNLSSCGGSTSSDHGLTLELGVYVAKIQPGSVAAKEGVIATGDRIVSINEYSMDHIESLPEAVKFLNACASNSSTLTLTLAKSTNALVGLGSSVGVGLLSSSSSGHNLPHQMDKLDDESHSKVISPKMSSVTTSPIKDTIRESQELFKKLISSGSGSGSKDRYPGLASSSSSEKVYNHKMGSKESKGPLGLMGTVIDTVRGRRRSKDPSDRHEQMGSCEIMPPTHESCLHSDELDNKNNVENNSRKAFSPPPKGNEDVVLAELDSMLNSVSYNSGSSGAKSSSSGKKRRVRDTFKSGGTWPRARGGPIIEQGTGTVLHPQKVKKERLPLAELLYNPPKYPPHDNNTSSSTSRSVVYRNEDHLGGSIVRSSGGGSERKSRPFTTYDFMPTSMYSNRSGLEMDNRSKMSNTSGGGSGSNNSSGSCRHQDMKGHTSGHSSDHKSNINESNSEGKVPVTSALLQSLEAAGRKALSPSDTSIDESVKSAQHAEVLNLYSKKFPMSSSALLHHHTYTPPMSSSGTASNSGSAAYPSGGGTLKLQQHNFSNSSTMPHLVRPSSFSPYYMPPPPPHPTSGSQGTSGHHHLVTMQQQQQAPTPVSLMHHHGHSLSTSSPRYASPPPLNSGQTDNILGSPIPDYRGSYGLGSYQPNMSHLSSVSPTNELGHYGHTHSHLHHHHSPSPGGHPDSYGSGKPRSATLPPPPPPLHPLHSQHPPYHVGLPLSSSHHYFPGSSQIYNPIPQYHLHQSEAASPPPHYVGYSGPSGNGGSVRRAGKENDGITARISGGGNLTSEKSDTFPRKRREREAPRSSPKMYSGTLPSSSKRNSAAARSAATNRSSGPASAGLIGQQSARHRSGRRRVLAARVDSSSSSSDDYEGGGVGGKNGSSSSGPSRRYTTLRRRNSRDLLNSNNDGATSGLKTAGAPMSGDHGTGSVDSSGNTKSRPSSSIGGLKKESSPTNRSSSSGSHSHSQHHKSSECILESKSKNKNRIPSSTPPAARSSSSRSKGGGALSEGELLSDKKVKQFNDHPGPTSGGYKRDVVIDGSDQQPQRGEGDFSLYSGRQQQQQQQQQSPRTKRKPDYSGSASTSYTTTTTMATQASLTSGLLSSFVSSDGRREVLDFTSSRQRSEMEKEQELLERTRITKSSGFLSEHCRIHSTEAAEPPRDEGRQLQQPIKVQEALSSEVALDSQSRGGSQSGGSSGGSHDPFFSTDFPTLRRNPDSKLSMVKTEKAVRMDPPVTPPSTPQATPMDQLIPRQHGVKNSEMFFEKKENVNFRPSLPPAPPPSLAPSTRSS